MKKGMFHKGMAAALAVSLTAGGALPFMAQTVHAEDTTAEQGQTPEKQNGVVSLEKKDGSYIFGNEYLKRTFSVSTEKYCRQKRLQTIAQVQVIKRQFSPRRQRRVYYQYVG